MNRDLHEELSRLLDDDLPEARAAELRRQIATDADVARAWESMSAMTADLAELPLDTPPDALDRRILGATPGASDSRVVSATSSTLGPRFRRWLLPAAAAALVLFALWPSPEPELILTSGSQYVEGHVMVLAADVPVEVDGVAVISVEPADSARRVPLQEDTMLNKNTILAAAAGAVVTVAVYEGSALIDAGGEDSTTIRAGETQTVGTPDKGRGLLNIRGRGAAAATPDTNTQQLTAEIARLEEELDGLRMEATLARGQLGHYEGTAQPWPDDVPASFRPEAFESALEKALANAENLELLELDCQEFPCVAVIRSHTSVEGWIDGVRGRIDDPEAMGFGDGTGISIWASNSSTDDGDVRLVGFAAIPVEEMDEDAHARTNFRANQLLKDSTEGILEGDEDR